MRKPLTREEAIAIYRAGEEVVEWTIETRERLTLRRTKQMKAGKSSAPAASKPASINPS